MRFAIPGGVIRFAPLLTLFLFACGPDFDPPSELHSLRVLAVQKDVPYAQPGQEVHLQMLWEDASPKAGRPIQVAWSPACFDPAGDLYYGCFTQPGVFDTNGEKQVRVGDNMSFTMPTTIIPPADRNDPRNAPHGLAYVFFGVCAGTLEFVAPTSDSALPVVCKDADGKLLGADDFVAGYTAVYSFKTFSNNNPVISGFEFNGQPLKSDACLGADCLSPSGGPVPPNDVDCDDPVQALRCVPTCADDGGSKCKGYALRPTVDKTDPANHDEDSVSAALLGRTVGEQMWINYYTDAGGFKSPVRLLNDATSGWNDNYGTDFYAPKDPGLFRVWSVVHDNRGGVAWSGITLKAQ